MSRLTHRNENGEARVWLYSDPKNMARVLEEQAKKEVEVLEKLCHYEDLEEKLMESAELDIDSMVGEFMHYYKLKKEGRLIELPCKMGDTVWTTRWWDRKVITKEIDGEIWYREINKHKVTKGTFSFYDIDKIGIDVFLTKAEAEAKLAELEKENEQRKR